MGKPRDSKEAEQSKAKQKGGAMRHALLGAYTMAVHRERRVLSDAFRYHAAFWVRGVGKGQ